jgi:hypothetical protein
MVGEVRRDYMCFRAQTPLDIANAAECRNTRSTPSPRAPNQPNITAVHDIGVDEGSPYIVTELLEGRLCRAAAVEERSICDTPEVTLSTRILGTVMVVLASAGCAHITEAEKARQQANAAGKYKVRLTQDAEGVQGTCQFLRSIEPDQDPINRPSPSQRDDWYRVEAVLLGADTVLVRDRSGEAYICGAGPLNPDGTARAAYTRVPPAQHQ